MLNFTINRAFLSIFPLFWPLIFHSFQFYVSKISVMRGEHRSFIFFERLKDNHFLIARGIFNSSSDAL